MPEKKKPSKKDKNPSSEQVEKIEEKISSYEKLLDRLKEERKHVEDELKKDYHNARRYVRSHPEEGVLFSFVGGIILGIMIGKLTR